jgi:hypothetical protein
MNVPLDLAISHESFVPRLPVGIVFEFINHEFEQIVGSPSVKYEKLGPTYPCIRRVPVFLVTFRCADSARTRYTLEL